MILEKEFSEKHKVTGFKSKDLIVLLNFTPNQTNIRILYRDSKTQLAQEFSDHHSLSATTIAPVFYFPFSPHESNWTWEPIKYNGANFTKKP